MGYRWYASAENTQHYKPMFAFGHGLSYTDYRYDGYTAKGTKDGGLDVSVRIKNTGHASGSESPQVYVGPSKKLPATIEQARTKLVQFDRVDLAPGESERVRMHVAPRELSSWSESAQKWVLGTGPRTVAVGAASDDIRGSSTVVVKASTTAPRVTRSPVTATTAYIGDTVTLKAAASGTPAPTVHWQSSTDGGSEWTNVSDASTYRFTATAAQDGTLYRALFTNELGSAATTPTTLTVSKADPTVKATIKNARITIRERQSVDVRVTTPAQHGATGRVELTVTNARGVTVATAKVDLRDGRVNARLPRIERLGTYSVQVDYAGDTSTNAATASTKTFTVTKR